MAKLVAKSFEVSDHDKLRDAILDSYQSYIFITCGLPRKDGKMDVEMSYEGDLDLVVFLLRHALTHLD